jgi:hypothetical protein
VNASDLGIVRISADAEIATVPTGEASAIVGRRAVETLSPHSLLTMSDVASNVTPLGGASIVGIDVKEGQFPATGLAPGDRVDVVFTAPPGDQESSIGSQNQPGTTSDASATSSASTQSLIPGTILVSGSMILDMTGSPDAATSGAVDVSLLVSSSLAPEVAAAATAGQVALVIVGTSS